jgi:hypothetical protein
MPGHGNLRSVCFFVIAVLLLALYGLAGAIYWRGSGAGAPLQEPMHYVDQYRYPRAWTRSQLAPGVPEPTPFAAVYGPNSVGQRFRSCCNNLALVRVWLGNASGQRVVFGLRASPEQSRRADTLIMAAIRLERDGYHAFAFPPLPDSAGQVYDFFVESPDATADEAVALRVAPGDRVGGVPLLNEYTAAGNLDFATYHQGLPGSWLLNALAEQVLPQTFAARLQQYKPGFFKSGVFFGGLVAIVAGAFVWLVIAWPGKRRPAWQRGVVGLMGGILGVGVLVAAATGVMLWPRRAAAGAAARLGTSTSSDLASVTTDGDGPALVYDLLLSLYPAEKKPERRFFSTAWAEIEGRQKPCIVAPPDSSLHYGLRLPPEATLHLAAALETAGAWRLFEVSIAGDEVLFSRELHGPDRARAAVNLTSYGGQDVRLVLRTVGEESDASPGLWCAPQIESTRSWLMPYPLPVDVNAHLQPATFGDALELLGYRLETSAVTPGDQVILTLYWHARQRVTTGYTVFVHLLDETGEMRGQRDSQPVSGAYPTTLWSPEKVIVDRYILPVDRDAPPGQYRLAVGLYDLATLQRLPALDGERRRLEGDRQLLKAPIMVNLP